MTPQFVEQHLDNLRHDQLGGRDEARGPAPFDIVYDAAKSELFVSNPATTPSPSSPTRPRRRVQAPWSRAQAARQPPPRNRAPPRCPSSYPAMVGVDLGVIVILGVLALKGTQQTHAVSLIGSGYGDWRSQEGDSPFNVLSAARAILRQAFCSFSRTRRDSGGRLSRKSDTAGLPQSSWSPRQRIAGVVG